MSRTEEMSSSDKAHAILVVDDNPTNLGVLSDYLHDNGYRVLIARSGESALEKAHYAQPDLILLDIMMPGMDGFQTCEHLKSDSRTQDIPVIFITALAQTEHKVKGFQVGAVDYVTKPLQYEEVIARVSTHLKIRDLTHGLQDKNEHLQQVTAQLRETNAALLKRTVQLETNSQVGKQVTSILNLAELLDKVVQLIQTKFEYYFVGIWLVDEKQNKAVLQARAGAAESLPESGLGISLEQDNSAIAWVCREGEHYLVEDVATESHYLALAELPAVRTELVLPLLPRQQIIGGLHIASSQPEAFGPDDRILLQSLADEIAIAIRNAQLYETEQHRRQLAESLEHTGRVLSSNLDLRQVSGCILEELAEVVPYERGLVLLKRNGELRSIAQKGFPDDERAGQLRVSINSGDIFSRLNETHRPILIEDVTQDSGWRQLDWLPWHHSWLGVPLISKERVIGMMSLTRSEVDAFSDDDATLVLAFAGQAAIALENAGLYDEIHQMNQHLEQKVAERTAELNEANRILERLDKNKNDFISVTSHELRTPLSIIKGYSQILGSLPDIQRSPTAASMLASVDQGVERMHQIVSTMLDVVKIDSQVLDKHREPVRLAELMEKVYMPFDEVLQERQLSLTVAGLEELPEIQGHPDLLHKVFHNLLVNAIKYTPDGGTLSIKGQPITMSAGQGGVEIVISDSGIGIDPEHQELIFEKFYQTGEVAFHSTGLTKFKGGGPGLGLAVAKGIVLAHGGQVWVESESYDEQNCPGSDFYVHLPVTAAARKKRI